MNGGNWMEAIIILTVIVGILAVLQGWQMIAVRRSKKSNSSNPTIYMKQNNILEKLDNIGSELSDMNSKLDGMKQRLDDVWDKIKT